MGLLLLLIPWSTFWDRNYFVETVPVIRDILTNNFMRGAVSGLGIANVLTAIAELADIFGRSAPSERLPHSDSAHDQHAR